MKLIHTAAVFLFVAAAAESALLPGFRAERVASVDGFPTSIAADSRGTIYYTTADGGIYRFTAEGSVRLAEVGTQGDGNSGLLGMALLDDNTAVVHYTTPAQTHDIVARVDLGDGSETVLQRFVADIQIPGAGSSSEHHGGNPFVRSDGTIFVGIGDYARGIIASDPLWNGGKIFRIAPDGTASQFARGLRNPFDLAWDERRQRLIVADNGPIGGDELHIIEEGADCGWPHTYGTEPAADGAAPPDYVFPMTVAPTGLLLLSDAQTHLRGGILLGGFVTRAIYFFPDLDQRPISHPIVLLEKETAAVIDLVQAPDGTVWFVTGAFVPGGSGIYRLLPPLRGDCNGDGWLERTDLDALNAELADGAQQSALEVHGGAHAGSWGCDVDQDGMVTAADAAELTRMLGFRRRAAGR